MIVTIERLKEVGLTETEIESILHERELSWARWYLLQAQIMGMDCENPQKYQTDCGKCNVCKCRYREGALN